jgi:hypothetical protein
LEKFYGKFLWKISKEDVNGKFHRKNSEKYSSFNCSPQPLICVHEQGGRQPGARQYQDASGLLKKIPRKKFIK